MKTYIVKPGDTLSVLASRLLGQGSTYHDLWKLNPQITNPDLIHVGQVIYYPETGVKVINGAGVKAPFSISPTHIIYMVAAVLIVASFMMMQKGKRRA